MFNQQQQQFRYQPTGINQTMFESSLSFLKQLNSNELESLEKDEERIHKLVEDCEQVRQLQSDKENLLTSNKSLAEYNLSQGPKLNQAKVLLAKTYEDAVEISKKYDHNRMLLEGTPTKNSSDVQLALLQTECAKNEEACEQLASDFLSGKLDLDGFLGRYVETRTLSHVRKVKCDKMSELLKQDSNPGSQQQQHRRQYAPTSAKQPAQPFAPSFSAYINTGASPPYPTQSSSHLPYPMPSYSGPSYGPPLSMPAPYINYQGAYPHPNLH